MATASHVDPVAAPEPMDVPDFERASGPLRWLAPALAIAAALLWVGGGMWWSRDTLPTIPAPALISLVGALCSVPVLIGIMWLLLLRTSRVEAGRFGRTGEAMRAEAAALEHSVARLSASLEAIRITLGEQAHDLAAIGDVAAGRLADVGRGFVEQIALADRHAGALASAADAAGASLAALLAAMPRLQADASDAGERLDRAARGATAQAEALDARLVALAARGHEAETVAGGAAAKLADHIARMDATGESAGQRLEAVTAAMSEQVDALMLRTAAAVDQSRSSIAAQGDAMLAMVGANQAALDTAARESAEALAERIHVVELVIERIAARLDAQRQTGHQLIGGLEDGLTTVAAQLDALHAQGVDRTQTLAASIGALGGSADAMTEALKAGEAMATRAIGTAETLLIALDSAAREIDETLPDALGRLDARVAASQRAVAAARPELLALVTAAESTHDAIEAIAQVIAQQRTTVDQLSGTLLDTLATGRARADALGKVVDDTVGRTHRFAEDAAPRLVEALLRVRDTATAAADKARETLASVIPEAAAAMEGATVDAMRRATDASLARRLTEIGQAADRAAETTARASGRLDQQLQAFADRAAAVDAQLAAARDERETVDRDSFARRVSLLIEALNSASIDITKSFAPDVADTAWAAYLKGDRGVFTRRAVRLLDGADAREIARLYDGDAGFREQVNRYIHDFEAMLRGILDQREGSHLGVALLSSDMGKLYVALAQAIERLR